MIRTLSRIFCLAALSLAMAVAARAGSVAELDQANGLPDAKLGTPLVAMPGLEKTEDVGRWLTYRRPADTLRFGRVKVKGIAYNFFKEKLYSINLDLEGKGNVTAMLKQLEREYGKDHTLETRNYPHMTARLEIREWSGARVYCVFKNATDFDGGSLTLLDKPTWDLLQAPKREQQSQNREKLKGSFLNGDF